jgi:hypothetical protein
MKQARNASFNLIKVIQIHALELALSNDEIQSLISLTVLKLFKKFSRPLNSE